jgi:ComF family protein
MAGKCVARETPELLKRTVTPELLVGGGRLQTIRRKFVLRPPGTERIVVDWYLRRRWIFPSSPRVEVNAVMNFAAFSKGAVHRVLSGLFSLVFPDNCRLCEAPLTGVSRVPVCRKCLSAPEPYAAEYRCITCAAPFVTPHPLDDDGRCGLCRRGLSGFDAAFAFGFYEGPLRKLIQLFKYGNIPTLAGPLGAMVASALPRERSYDVLVPMPLHWRRRLKRGFNQSKLLADVASRRLGIPVSAAVRRSKATPPQAGLTGAQRRANVAAAFVIARPESIRGKRVLLVDDVLTTGATAGACAQVLKRAGAVHVAVLTVARADRRTLPVTAWDQGRIEFSTSPLGSVFDGQSGTPA